MDYPFCSQWGGGYCKYRCHYNECRQSVERHSAAYNQHRSHFEYVNILIDTQWKLYQQWRCCNWFGWSNCYRCCQSKHRYVCQYGNRFDDKSRGRCNFGWKCIGWRIYYQWFGGNDESWFWSDTHLHRDFYSDGRYTQRKFKYLEAWRSVKCHGRYF